MDPRYITTGKGQEMTEVRTLADYMVSEKIAKVSGHATAKTMPPPKTIEKVKAPSTYVPKPAVAPAFRAIMLSKELAIGWSMKSKEGEIRPTGTFVYTTRQLIINKEDSLTLC
jgi:hypothetical protein